MTALEGSQPGMAHLLGRLEVELDETVVVTLAAVLDDELWRLRFGSVIVGPPALAEQSWPEWQSPGREALLSLLGAAGYPAEVWRSFDHIVDGWRFLRFTLPVGNLQPWLAGLFDEQTASHPFDTAPVSAVAAPADALLRTFPHQETSISGLVAGADRPLIGWVHPLPIEGENTPEAPPWDWQLGEGPPLTGAPLQLAGFATQSARGLCLFNGILIGRMERRAWFRTIRGGKPDLETFEVHLGLDPLRISLWELAIDLEELDQSGNMIGASRLRLADTVLPQHGPEDVLVVLPTMGRKVVRRLRLYDTEGGLLDCADDVHLVEQVNITVEVMGAPSTSETTMTSRLGSTSAAPTLVSRLSALDRVQTQYRDLLQAGAGHRVVGVGDDGREMLKQRLRAARGELRIFDPWFYKPDDWVVLEEVAVPIRVLGGGKLGPPPARPPKCPSVSAKRWPGHAPPFHDRAYLWNGGGIVVGTSPAGLGNRLSLIDQLEPAVSELLGNQFEAWWADPRAVAV